MRPSKIADFNQTRTIYPPWHVKFVGEKISKKFSRISEKFHNGILAPAYSSKISPCYFSAPRCPTAGLDMVFGDPLRVLENHEKKFTNFWKFREIRPIKAKNDLFSSAKKCQWERKTRKFFDANAYYIRGTFQKSKKIHGSYFFLEIFGVKVAPCFRDSAY